MPSKVYSHRFHNHSVGGKTWIWTVPAGKRAVVSFAALTSYEPPPASAGVSLNGVPLWLALFQVAGRTEMTSLRAVAYEGDEIQLYLPLPLMYGHVSGYLFEDPQGPPGQAGVLPTDPIPDFPPPPSPSSR